MGKYNLSNEMKIFEVYNGSIVKRMPKLISNGRVPANISQIMQRRLNLRNDETGVKSFYLSNHFNTSDAVLYHPDGRVKIVLDSKTLMEITPESELKDGALVLTEEFYDALQGEEFKKGKLGKINEWLTDKEVKSHLVWKILARDQMLLDDYVDYIFAEGRKKFDYHTGMGIYPDSAGSDVKMMAWCISRIGYRSNLLGRYALNYDRSRLLGIISEAPISSGKK